MVEKESATEEKTVEVDKFESELDALFKEFETPATKKDESKGSEFMTHSQFEDSMSKFFQKFTESIGGRSDRGQSSDDDEESDSGKSSLSDIQKQVKTLQEQLKEAKSSNPIEDMRLELRKERLREETVQLFEEKTKEKFPHFKVNTLQMKYDLQRGLSEKESLMSQLDSHSDLINRISGKDTGPATRLSNPDVSQRNVPADLMGFDPELHTKKVEFHKLTSVQKEEHWRKLEKFMALK